MTIDTPPRSTSMTPDIAEAVGCEFAKDLAERYLITRAEIAPLARDIAKHAAIDGDGYALARALDTQDGYRPTTAWVFALDGVARRILELIIAEQRRWAAKNAIPPAYSHGTRVRLKGGDTGVVDFVVGFVYDGYPASYAVAIDDDPLAGTEKRRRIVPFEDVTPLAEEEGP